MSAVLQATQGQGIHLACAYIISLTMTLQPSLKRTGQLARGKEKLVQLQVAPSVALVLAGRSYLDSKQRGSAGKRVTPDSALAQDVFQDVHSRCVAYLFNKLRCNRVVHLLYLQRAKYQLKFGMRRQQGIGSQLYTCTTRNCRQRQLLNS